MTVSGFQTWYLKRDTLFNFTISDIMIMACSKWTKYFSIWIHDVICGKHSSSETVHSGSTIKTEYGSTFYPA